MQFSKWGLLSFLTQTVDPGCTWYRESFYCYGHCLNQFKISFVVENRYMAILRRKNKHSLIFPPQDGHLRKMTIEYRLIHVVIITLQNKVNNWTEIIVTFCLKFREINWNKIWRDGKKRSRGNIKTDGSDCHDSNDLEIKISTSFIL